MRLGVALAVILLHLALVLALIRAFAPDFTARVTEQVLGAVTVTITAPPPQPSPAPPLPADPDPVGAAAPAGKRAEPRPVAAPAPRVVVATTPAPPVAAQGRDDNAGAQAAGNGTGAGDRGSGTGAGSGGSGTGGGSGSKATKIAGDINAARDYPAASRELRLGDYVIVALTVSTEGRVKACRVHRASRDPQADQITCRLATERFRFRPATDGQGNPVEATFGWQQRWFAPAENK